MSCHRISHPFTRTHQRGFTLVELAIVLVIVALLTSGLLMSLSAQQSIQTIRDTETRLATIEEALLGYAAASGRLPCPATATSVGQEAFCLTASGACTETTVVQSHGRCAQFLNGLLPGAALGLRPVDATGKSIDAWNNPIRYSIFDLAIGGTNFPFTASNGLRNATLPNLASADLLTVCDAFPGSGATSCGTAASLTKKAPVVLVSTGKNGSITSNTDENGNLDNDRFFVSHTPSAASGTDPGFDDIVVWLTPNILYNRMIAAGRLP